MTDEHQIMLVTDQGQMIRMPVSGIRFTGRAAQGVTLFRVRDDEKVVSVAWLKQDEEDEAEDVIEGNEEIIDQIAAEENEGGGVTTDTPEDSPADEADTPKED